MRVRTQKETPEGYRARATAAFKIGRRRDGDWLAGMRIRQPRYILGEFLHQADIEGA